jgi:hypothetical protein
MRLATYPFSIEPAEYFDMLTSDQILVMGVNFVSDETVEMRYQDKEEFVEEYGRTNQGVLVVESDASHFTYGRISILVGSGNLVGIVLRYNGDKLYYSVVGDFIGEIS